MPYKIETARINDDPWHFGISRFELIRLAKRLADHQDLARLSAVQVFRDKGDNMSAIQYSCYAVSGWPPLNMSQPEVKTSQRTSAEPREQKWAARLRGFGPVGILVIAVIPFAGTAFIGAVLVLLWARISHTPLREIGYVAPRSWTRTIVGGIIVGVAFKLAMKAVVMPLLGAAPVNQTYHYLVGNLPATAFMALFVTVSGGFGEETVYRGFLFERFCKLFRSGPAAKPLALVLTSLWFAAMHYPDQGLAGAEQAVITGFAFGMMFLMTRSLAMPMVTHAAFDLIAIALIYWDLETRIAHLVFR